MRKMMLAGALVAGLFAAGCACRTDCCPPLDKCDPCYVDIDSLNLGMKMAHPDVQAGQTVTFDDGLTVRTLSAPEEKKSEDKKKK